jgi:hypothetical protein
MPKKNIKNISDWRRGDRHVTVAASPTDDRKPQSRVANQKSFRRIGFLRQSERFSHDHARVADQKSF